METFMPASISGVNRIASVDEDLIEQFDAISAPLLTISRQLQKSIAQQLQDQRRAENRRAF